MKSIAKINTKHRLIMYRLLAGQTQKQIANDLGLSETWVSLVKSSDIFKEEYQRLVDMVRAKVIDTSSEVQEIINCAAPTAAKKIVELMESSDSKIQLKASEKVVDYSDFGRDLNKEANKPIILTQQQMMLIDEAIQE